MVLDFVCPCCGHAEFTPTDILWPELVKEWQLSKNEAAYINRQQGLACANCHSNLRSMTLARAMMDCYGAYNTTLVKFLKTHPNIKLLELNEAGNLNPFLKNLKHHTLASYPDVNIQKLPYKDDSFDLVIHSDTLEHVDKPLAGLAESLRVLKPGGYTCFTIPLVVGRLSKRRPASQPSYHGSPGNKEYLVITEYGADMWAQVIEAGFYECRLTSLEFPSSIALTGFKKPSADYNKAKYQKFLERRR
jgi:SAM-dependent methyltransferase